MKNALRKSEGANMKKVYLAIIPFLLIVLLACEFAGFNIDLLEPAATRWFWRVSASAGAGGAV